MELPQIIFQIGNETVKGEITFFSEKSISVKILSPYQNITNGVSVPYFSRKSIEENEAESYGKTLLTSIYQICEFATVNKEILLQKLAITKHEIQPVNELIILLTEEKINIKNKFKNRQINKVAYQQQLTKAKLEKMEKDFEIVQRWSNYFESFPMVVPIDMQMPIIELIEQL